MTVFDDLANLVRTVGGAVGPAVVAIGTRGRGTSEITDTVRQYVKQSGVISGVCNIFLHHTSASLILCENYEPDVRRDLEVFFAGLVPDGDRRFVHRAEGPDDMPAHLKAVLTGVSLSIPVIAGRLALGHWQGIFLAEHRRAPHRREVALHLAGS